MPIYPGRRAGTWRVTAFSPLGGQREKVVEGLKKDARRTERELQGQMEQRKQAERRSPTFADFSIETYEPHAKMQFGAQTWKRNRKYVVATLVRAFGGLRLDAIDTRHVEDFKRARLGAGMLARSINAELKILKAMLRWAREDLKLPCSAPKVKLLREDKSARVKAWTLDEIARLYRALSKHLIPIVQFLLNTGCRKGEAVACEWAWIDLGARMLRIPVNEYWRPKDGEPREVPLPDSLVAMLEALPSRGKDRFVFISTLGTPFAEFPQKTFDAATDKAGVGGSPHCTRHTYASHFLQARPDLRLLAQVLGHSTTRVTELYAHMLPGHLEQARGAVNLPPITLAATLAKSKKARKSSSETQDPATRTG